jgi:3',5'-cyclic AMP phosphodiesterase CpdA
MSRKWAWSLCLLSFAGCTSSEDEPVPSPYVPTPLPPLGAAPLTDAVTIVPRHPVESPADERTSADPAAREAMRAEGLGELDLADGEAHVGVTPAGEPIPEPGPNARLLVRFAHVADMQLADDESPARLCRFDAPTVTDAAFRPQEAHGCRIVNAVVRTVRAVHEDLPLDFVLLGGDNVDNAQENELRWVMAMLDGSARVECDSGNDDDPVAGPDDDPKDPFVADGLPVPWLWVTGNHDVLEQGNLVVNEASIAAATAASSVGGTRDWSQPGGPIVTENIVPDASRRLLDRAALTALVAGDGDGHGLGPAEEQSGNASYHYDVQGTPLRLIVLDTGAETGGSEGLLRRDFVDGWLTDELDAALADGKWVILASHHRATALGDGTGLGGTMQPDAVLADEYIELVGGYPNVLYSVVGHSHVHDVSLVEPAMGHAWWEVVTSAIADYPHQARIVEVWDQDDGWLMLRATAFDFATDDDPVAAEGRTFGIIDFTSGWAKDGRGDLADRNVELWIHAPP